MDSFYIDLNEMSSKKPRIKRLLLFGACLCVGLFLSSLSILISFNSPLEWVLLIAFLYLALYIYYAWITYKAELFVKANAEVFEYKFGLLKKSKNILLWDVVTKVRLGPAYITFYKKSGRRKKVSLSWLPYIKVVEIKDKLVQMCVGKKIVYEKVDFIRYSEKKKKKSK